MPTLTISGETELEIDIDLGVITGVGQLSNQPADQRSDNHLDLSGYTVLPGLVDLQVNGGWGIDLTLEPERVWELARHMLDVGVTSWLPTLVSAKQSTRQRALDALAAGPPEGWVGAQPLGWHFEGPWLSPGKPGAHKPSSLLAPPSALDVDGLPLLVTLAPELDGAHDLIRSLVADGVVVSIGHTLATSAEVGEAVAVGATMGTHLFNAMSGLSHRDPGTAAGLLDSKAFLGLIVDGHHVAPELVRLVWTAAADRIVLVSDVMAAAGLPEGENNLAGRRVTVADNAARLADGTLAGSVTHLVDAVANLAETVGCPITDAVRVASAQPADAIRRPDLGRIAVGCRADLTVVDSDWQVVGTVVGGHWVPGNKKELSTWKS